MKWVSTATPLPTDQRSVDLPLKGGGEKGGSPAL